jgi:hypothetical protein
MAVFWFVAPCSLVEVHRRFRGTCCLHHRPDDGGRKYLRNVGKFLPDYTALQTRGHSSFVQCRIQRRSFQLAALKVQVIITGSEVDTMKYLSYFLVD